MTTGPIGSTATEASEQGARRSARYRALQDAHADARELAWLVIRYRMVHGLSQQDLASRIGTSHSQISRIESGRRMPSIETLGRIADVLDQELVVSFRPRRTTAHSTADQCKTEVETRSAHEEESRRMDVHRGDYQDWIVVDPLILAGKPVIKGTRVSVSLILNLLAHGYSTDRIVRAYPILTPDAVQAAISYAADRLDREEVRVFTPPA